MKAGTYLVAVGYPSRGGYSDPTVPCCMATIEVGPSESDTEAKHRALTELRRTRFFDITGEVRYVIHP